MAHQFPNQLLDRGENGRRVYNSIMENASSKVVFRLTHEENLAVMAKWLFMGVMNPDEIKHELYSTKVMEYREEMKEVRGYGKSSGSSHGTQQGRSSGHGSGGTEAFFGDGEGANGPHSSSFSESDFSAESSSESESYSESESESVSYVPTLIPVLGKELSHVQFRSLEEQLFRSMAVLFDQKERHGVARLVGMNAPVSIRTPTIEKMPAKTERTQMFLASCCARYPFAMYGSKARRLLQERAATLSDTIANQIASEPDGSKRKIR